MFSSYEHAMEWMEKTVGDDNADNYRFAYLDDPEEVKKYIESYNKGCCGYFDELIEVGMYKKLALIGCNYGH